MMPAKIRKFDLVLGETAREIDDILEKLLLATALPGELHRPHRLMEAMRYSALGAGKRLRPLLLIETARLFGVTGHGVLRAAAALEMVHCYSLIHDDLPAMDDDDIRRGKPTLHKAFDEATAILSGDALLTYAFDILSDSATDADPERRLRLVSGLARAAGQGGMVGGQMMDLAAEAAVTALSRENIELLQAMKTGALLHYAVEAGGLLGQCHSDQAKLLSRFGRKLGAAFQIADDLLDFTGDSVLMGKKVGKDAGRNKATLVSILGINGAENICKALADEAKAILQRVVCP